MNAESEDLYFGHVRFRGSHIPFYVKSKEDLSLFYRALSAYENIVNASASLDHFSAKLRDEVDKLTKEQS